MLGKLFKYDMKALSRLLVLIHIPLPLLAAAARYQGVERLFRLQKPDIPAVILLVTGLIFACFVTLFTELYIAVYTYKNFFTYEGYLTMTLPVKTSTHVLSKFLSGSLWLLIDAALVYSCVWIVCSEPHLVAVMEKTAPEISPFFSMDGGNPLGMALMLATLAGTFGYMPLIIGSLCFGHCFSKNRILISVLGYFGILTVLQLIGGGIGAAISIRSMSYLKETGETMSLLDTVKEYQHMFLLFIPLLFLMAAGCYIFSCYTLKKRLNLD